MRKLLYFCRVCKFETMARIKVTRDNYKKFSKSALLPGRKSRMHETPSDMVMLSKNVTLLNECEYMYSSLQDFREKRQECIDYYFGNQLSRLVPDPDGCGQISLEKYAIKQGMTPLKMNIITSRIRQMIGVYEKQKLEDLTLARDRDEQKLGEMMSVAMQYVYQNNNLYRANADGYREFLLSALPCYRVGYDFDSNRKLSDVYIDLEDINKMFWDNNTSGLYFKNISTIGKLHEFSLLEILSKFAKTPAMRRALLSAYDEVQRTYPLNQQFSRDNSQRKYSFYTPYENYKYRVIEVWRREESEVYVCTDPLDDEPYVINVNQLGSIIAENNRRQSEMSAFGGDPADAATIDYEYRVDTEWVVRFLTPCGHILYQAVSPYAHSSHPWAIGGYPMVDGRVQSLVYDLIPAQDMVNRLVMRMEYIRMNQAKGFGIIDLDVLEDSDMTVDEFARKYTSPKGIAALRCKGVGNVNNVFARFTDDGGTNSDYQMLSTYIEMINQQSGSTDAARGEKGGSHESASRYMMETENSNNNTCDGEQWFNGLILERDRKMMMLMQQYYTGIRYMNIAGHQYSEEAKYYDADKIRQTQFDLSIVQAPSSGIVRMQMEDTLKTMFEQGAIDADTWLQSTASYGADKILQVKKANEEKMAAQQQAMQQAQQGGEAPSFDSIQQAVAQQPNQQPQQIQ